MDSPLQDRLTIPGAPPRDVLVHYQAAHVGRVRAILAIQGARRRGDPALPDAVRELELASATLGEIEERHPIPFVVACKTLRLSILERDALLTIASPHLDDRIRDAIADFWGRPARNHVDAALLVQLFGASLDDVVGAGALLRDGSTLHRAGLIESVPVALTHTPSQLEHELVPTPRLLRLLDAQAGLDPRFRTFSQVIESDAAAATGVVSRERLDELGRLVVAGQSAAIRRGAHFLLAGPAGAGKLRVARALAAVTQHRRILVVEAAFLPTDPPRLGRVLEALAHEAQILGARLVLRRVENLIDGRRQAAVLRRILEGLGFPVWLTSDVDPGAADAPHLADLAGLTLSVSLPLTEERREAWRLELARSQLHVADAVVASLGADFPLSRSAIESAVQLAGAQRPAPDAVETVLVGAAESQMRGQLARFARRSRSKVQRRDLVLTENTAEQVDEVMVAAQRRTAVMDAWGVADRHATGRGLVVLFNGPPGTGKTMAASAIANAIGLPLYRIDVSSIVDRYVGETEKNLTMMFEEASACRAALLFDEADSLFGKRIDAADASDRYANMQVNLLLNLIEDYDGFVVLTTNLKGALDTAFLRRIVYKVVFDMPEREQLRTLWQYHLPPGIPQISAGDLDSLADEFDQVCGGDIKNAVLRAALAAGADQPVTIDMLRRSMINELRANGSVVGEFRSR